MCLEAFELLTKNTSRMYTYLYIYIYKYINIDVYIYIYEGEYIDTHLGANTFYLCEPRQETCPL